MSKDTPGAPIDWVRVLHRGFTLIRAMRGDGVALEQDHTAETGRADKMTHTVEGIARQAVGCRAPDACECVVCQEQGQ